MSLRLAVRCAPLALALMLAACAEPERAPPASAALPTPMVPAAAGFDLPRAQALLQDAEREAEAGQVAAARDKVRDAALLWPVDAAAWERLATLSARLGDRAEARAARFMASRAELYSADSLAMQRQVLPALERIAQGGPAPTPASPTPAAGTPDSSLPTLTAAAPVPAGVEPYAAALARFYTVQYAKRGRHRDGPPPIFDLEEEEVPAAVITAGALAGYLGSFGLFR